MSGTYLKCLGFLGEASGKWWFSDLVAQMNVPSLQKAGAGRGRETDRHRLIHIHIIMSLLPRDEECVVFTVILMMSVENLTEFKEVAVLLFISKY